MPSRTPITALPGLGPAFEAECRRAGIDSAEALRALGTDAAYARLLAAGTRPHFIGFYVIEMALQGRPWNDCHGEEKAALRRRFDALKAAGPSATEDAAFEAMMDAIGVIDPARQRDV
ncbi:TfoX/Sxy family DNA transformation protein [Jannaschia seohaensis]|uniref:TfoX C-terminal domain-containing protein n=1 Tax=Jannaschia seohaensis TaxID=475081 RepID=A0A2Y9AAI0_9RHOB|nr:TfoX/Sxy family DNA transformation protein [Jannaschia seohaensis]PWJ21174.1 TfoX-like protein [Jannaschia seohaensis]SSA41584.1 TfoX C-terminal domain-containing protein [Jannaschia seohaensis]